MARTERRRLGGSTASASANEAGRSVRANLPRPSAPGPRIEGQLAAPHTRAPRRSPFGVFRKLTPSFARDIVAELKKVTWPTFQETRYLTIVVAIVSIAVGALLGVLDLFFGWAVEQLFF